MNGTAALVAGVGIGRSGTAQIAISAHMVFRFRAAIVGEMEMGLRTLTSMPFGREPRFGQAEDDSLGTGILNYNRAQLS